MNIQKPHYINNQWVEGTGLRFASINPADGKVLWEAHAADENEVNAAIEAARHASYEWSFASIETRISFLEKFQNAIESRKKQLAEAIAIETGKPLWEAETEIQAMMSKIAISIRSYYDRCKELTVQLPSGQAITRHKPHGVMAVFGPFNFPAHIPNGHIIPALLAGNTIVYKSSEYTPLVTDMVIHLWEECGLPKGVINMVQGGRRTGRLLASHPDINGLLVTGSWATGKMLLEQYAKHPDKILALELGGNNPLVVSSVQDIEAAVYTTIQSAYLSSGQRCSCARRLILIENETSGRFLQTLKTSVQNIKVGPHTDIPEPFMGPVVSESAANQILAEQEYLLSIGGAPIAPMQLLKEGTGLIGPGLIDATHVENRPDDEIFGPLLQLIRVPDIQAAIVEANNTKFGLSAGILTDDESEFKQFYQSAHAGIINWNTPLTGASSEAPFGGIGQSGNHRPSAYYAADYCAYPVASIESPRLALPKKLSPGITIKSEVNT